MNWRVLAVLFGSLASVCAVGIVYYFVLTSTPSVHTLHREDVLVAEDPYGTEAASIPAESSSVIDTSIPQNTDEGELPQDPPAHAPVFPQEAEQPPRMPYPVPAPFSSKMSPDHTHDGVLTAGRINGVRLALRLTPDQEPDWQAVASALRELSQEQMKLADAGQKPASALNTSRSAQLSTIAAPLINSLHDDQQQGRRELARIMGFKSLSALIGSIPQDSRDRKIASTGVPTSTTSVADAAPPVQRLVLPKINHRYDQALTSAEIARIKTSLRLTPDQERLWPQIDVILRELGRQQIAQIDAGQSVEYGMSGAMIQRFYAAASPLLATLRDDQKDEIRRRARILGLEAYASYL